MSERVELVELQESLNCGSFARATILAFDQQADDWKPSEGEPITVHESCGECCWDTGTRLWVYACPKSNRWEVLFVWWERGQKPKPVAYDHQHAAGV